MPGRRGTVRATGTAVRLDKSGPNLPGHRLTIYYQPDDPERANANGAVLTWVIPVLPVVAGLALIAVAA